MLNTERKDGYQVGDLTVKLTNKQLKKIILEEVRKCLFEMTTASGGAVEGFPAGFVDPDSSEGGDIEEESEKDQPSITTIRDIIRGTNNGR